MGERKGSYRDLQVWHRSKDWSVAVYHLTWKFPARETYALAKQMQRAAVSVPGNIAEGCARKGAGEFLQYLYISAGSLAETVTYLEIAQQLGYAEPALYGPLLKEADEIGRMLYGLIEKVKHGSRQNPSPPTTPDE